MTIVRLRETQRAARASALETTEAQAQGETRSSALTSWPGGWGWNDP